MSNNNSIKLNMVAASKINSSKCYANVQFNFNLMIFCSQKKTFDLNAVWCLNSSRFSCFKTAFTHFSSKLRQCAQASVWSAIPSAIKWLHLIIIIVFNRFFFSNCFVNFSIRIHFFVCLTDTSTEFSGESSTSDKQNKKKFNNSVYKI